jgi:hypothetical protein
MICLRRYLYRAVVIAAALPTLGGCASSLGPFNSPFASDPPPPAPVAAALPASLHAEDIVGRWGLASYHREQDRVRTEAAAKGQCSPQPYVINRSPTGGVAMLGHDNPQVQDMNIKGSAEGKTYIGPGPSPAGADDREVVSFDGRVLILKWVDPEVAGRYGNMVLVRCGAEGTTRTARNRKPPPSQ